jgi:hypothetical protein
MTNALKDCVDKFDDLLFHSFKYIEASLPYQWDGRSG